MSGTEVAGRRWIAGIALGLLLCGPAAAATYQIKLFEPPTGTGSGSFSFTNPGTPGSSTVTVADLATNASSTIGARNFVVGNLNAQVAAVNFNDGKVNAPGGANQITGNYVEYLTGELATAAAVGLTPSGICQTASCRYHIIFAFAPNTNPNLAAKTYKIELRTRSGTLVDTPVPNGTYAVSNTLTVPEPGTVALLALSLAGLAWVRSRALARIPVRAGRRS